MEAEAGAEAEGDDDSPLYKPPHSDGEKPPWPSDEAVERLREVRGRGGVRWRV